MDKSAHAPIKIDYFSDVLCIWAYIAQIRLDQLRKDFADKINLNCHYISVFGDAIDKIENDWKNRGGFIGYRKHIEHVCEKYDFISLHPDAWTKACPSTSMSSHLFLKAVEAIQQQDSGLSSDNSGRTLTEECAWQLRQAFFRDGRNIARRDEQYAIAETLSISRDAVEQKLNDGTAHARLSVDYAQTDQLLITGSPTFVLNEGRQKLYGNVGYRIIEANIHELLENPADHQASWC